MNHLSFDPMPFLKRIPKQSTEHTNTVGGAQALLTQ